MGSDSIQRLKDKLSGGEGLTAFEQMNVQEQRRFAEELKQAMLTQYGLLPGTREQYVLNQTDIA